MASLNLPPDPYLALGVSKDAKLPEIRSAHRKLVLKCHPDKVQDESLKAAKQDEFQKVQHAYEILSDETRRLQYDEQVKLFELRKEMGRGGATPKTNVFDFEVKTAEPRTSYATRSRGPPPPKIYTTHSPPKPTYDIPKMYEEVYEKAARSARKASYEASDRRREEDRHQREQRKRAEEEDKDRLKREKEKKRAAQGDRKKTRDKEKRRDTEEKRTRVKTYIEDVTDEEPIPMPREKTRSWDRQRMEEEARLRNESPRVAPSPRMGSISTPLTPKWDGHQDSAREYINAARSKVADDGFRHPGLRRGETFNGSTDTAYNLRYTTLKPSLSASDEDSPRRSSYRRRASDTPSTRPRESTRKEKEPSKRSSSRKAFGEIVDPPSPMPKTPTLKTTTSAPPLASEFSKPTRSRTEYPRKAKDSVPSPPLRSHTFQSGDRDRDRDRDRDWDRDRDRGRDREGSRLKQSFQYASSDEDSDVPIYASPRGSRSPPRPARGSRSPPRPQRVSSSPRRAEPPLTSSTHYKLGSAGVVPKTPTTRHRTEHRAELRNLGDDDYLPRDRSESPRGGRKSERPPLSGGGSRQTPSRSHSQSYFSSPVGEPVSIPVRPKMTREHGSRGSPLFAELTEPKFSPIYKEEDIRYSPHAVVDPYRRGSEPTTRDTYPSPRSGRGAVFAN